MWEYEGLVEWSHRPGCADPGHFSVVKYPRTKVL